MHKCKHMLTLEAEVDYKFKSSLDKLSGTLYQETNNGVLGRQAVIGKEGGTGRLGLELNGICIKS